MNKATIHYRCVKKYFFGGTLGQRDRNFAVARPESGVIVLAIAKHGLSYSMAMLQWKHVMGQVAEPHSSFRRRVYETLRDLSSIPFPTYESLFED